MDKAIVFDMDGTLTDSVSGIAKCGNEMLRRHGFPTYSVEEYNSRLVGYGMDELLRRALPDGLDAATAAECKTEYMELYLESSKRGAPLFPGVLDTLAALRGAGYKTAILTNKPQPMTDAIIESSFNGLIDVAWGPREGLPRKPDPLLITALMQSMGCSCAAYVGDSEVDVATGKNYGVFTVGVTWGTRSGEYLTAEGADAVADTAEELTGILLGI